MSDTRFRLHKPASHENGALPDPRRLLIASIAAILLLAVTVVGAAVYAVHILDEASVAGEIERARAAIAVVGTDAASAAQLQRDFMLDGARFTAPGTLADDEVAVPAGDSGQVLAWMPRRLGSGMFMQLAPLRVAASLTFLIGIAIVLRKLYQLTRELERRRREAQQLAHSDPLTGLGNRLAFARWVEDAAARGVTEVGLLYLDLDDFKAINDRFGHGGGDELLKAVAQRMSALAGPHDLVARMGGDEFAFVRRGPIDRAELSELAADIGTRLSEPVRIGTREVMAGSSLGAALGRPDDPRLLAMADEALYRAKALPGHTFVFADAA